jgi:hypothetical protein
MYRTYQPKKLETERLLTFMLPETGGFAQA